MGILFVVVVSVILVMLVLQHLSVWKKFHFWLSKKDGTREQFSRDKIFNGILMSAQKRPVSSEDIENAITRIEQNIRRNHDGEVDSDVIGNLVMKELADLDEITYVRFASVYRSFKDVDEIEELLQEITKTVRAKKESKK